METDMHNKEIMKEKLHAINEKNYQRQWDLYMKMEKRDIIYNSYEISVYLEVYEFLNQKIEEEQMDETRLHFFETYDLVEMMTYILSTYEQIDYEEDFERVYETLFEEFEEEQK